MHDLADKNDLCDQLQVRQMELQDVLRSVKNNGAVDVPPKGGTNTVKECAENSQEAENNNTQCHQGTQTYLFTFAPVDIVVHETLEEKQCERL